MAKIEDILQEKAFLKKVLECRTQGEIKAAFKEKGYEISESELEYLKEFFEEASQEVQKMSPEKLEQISGGVWDDLTGTEKARFASGSLVSLGGIFAGGYAGYKWAKSVEAKGEDIGKWGYTWRMALGLLGAKLTTGKLGDAIAGKETIKKYVKGTFLEQP